MGTHQQNFAPGLYLLATPIGNARDITLRGLDLLQMADVLVAEDTRNLRKFMDIHGVKLNGRAMLSYHDHSSLADRDRIVDHIAAGKSVAYVSDAGTPLIADPGFHLVKAVQDANLAVTALPGPSAVTNALCLAGQPTNEFLFAGFVPPNAEGRKKALARLLSKEATLVIYETAKRLPAFLGSLEGIAGHDHPITLCREMTKKFEEIDRTTVGALLLRCAQESFKGEVVLVIGAKNADEDAEKSLDEALLNALLTMRMKDASDSVAGALGLPRRQVYQRALELKSNTSTK